MKKQTFLTVLIVVVIVSLIAVMIVNLLPLVREVIASTGNESIMVDTFNEYGLTGIPILIGMQALIIVIAVIPAEAVQILTGLCFGAYRGALINLTGSVLGNACVFIAMRQMRTLIAPLFKGKTKPRKFISIEQLRRIKRPELVAFSFFLLPGIPNGFVPYLFAATEIKFHKYIIAVVAGSIPATFLLTYLGERVSAHNYTAAVIIAIAALIIVVVVLLFRKRIMKIILHDELPSELPPDKGEPDEKTD